MYINLKGKFNKNLIDLVTKTIKIKFIINIKFIDLDIYKYIFIFEEGQKLVEIYHISPLCLIFSW